MSTLRSVSGRGTRRAFSMSAALGLLLLAGPSWGLPASPQEDSPKPPPLFKPGSAEHKDAKLGLVPGELPKNATPEAVAIWKRALAAARIPVTGGAVPDLAPIDSFRLTFDLNWRNGPQTNFIPGAQLSFLSPGYVRTTLDSGRQLLRGPEGDFLLDRGKVERIEGRESAQDRKQLDDVIRLSKNFLSLANPETLRIRVLELSTPPAGLPKSHADDAAKLEWLRVESPDFYLLRADNKGSSTPPFGLTMKTKMYSARLGIDKATGLIRQAEILHLRETGEWSQSPLFLQFDKFFANDGFLIPSWMFVYDVESGSAKRGYTYKLNASSSLYLKTKIESGISLRTGLKPEDFLPPKEKEADSPK